MRRVRDTRLARLAAERTRFDTTSDVDGCRSRAWSTVCAVVRDGLVRAGIDPACAAALQLGEAALEVGGFGQPDERRSGEGESVAGDHDGLAGMFTTAIGDIVRRFRDGHDPDFASASLAELLAWCLSRRGSCSG